MTAASEPSRSPHAGQPVSVAGPPLGEGRGVAILVHGRNAGPANILDLLPRLARPDVTYLAPAAANRTWYPLSFLAEQAQNEPYLSSALDVLRDLVAAVLGRGVPRERVLLLGFSQGACLTAEFAVRHAARFGGLVLFSGGLIGPPGTSWDYGGSFEGTPVFLGCSDADAHVPATRVRDSARVFTRMGARVRMELYPGMGHLVSDEEVEAARQLLDGVRV
jgi:phospholipase/carboxylesterase